MDRSLTRRDFLKVVTAGTAASAALSGCGPFFQGFLDHGAGQAVATTCGECPAGCGLLVYPAGGGSLHLASNPAHPLQPPRGCARLQSSLQKLVSPFRYSGPLWQPRATADEARQAGWDDAIQAVASAFRRYSSDEIAFVLGLFPDHLNDLVHMLAAALGGANVLRFDPLGELEGRVTLMDAAQRTFGVSKLPYFDLRNSSFVFSFGSRFDESWLLPSSVDMRSYRSPGGQVGRQAYLVHFDEYGSAPAAWADEWIWVRQGCQAVLACTLGYLVSCLKDGQPSSVFRDIDLDWSAAATGVPQEQLWRLARLFHHAERPLALPGRTVLSGAAGPAAAMSILALNTLVANLGRIGGLFLAEEAPLYPWLVSRPSTAAEMQGLVERMRGGQIKVLFVHGVDLVAALPGSFELQRALSSLEQLFSFTSLPDETSRFADYILPDRLALESWGYQRTAPGCDRPAVSALQPAVQPPVDSRSTADVLLAAFWLAGGSKTALPFVDELDFVQQSVSKLSNRGGLYQALDQGAFWQLWLQHGGWWRSQPGLIPPVQIRSLERLRVGQGQDAAFASLPSEYPFRVQFLPFASATDRLQVQMHPQAARVLGLATGRRVKLVSPSGQIQARLRLDPQLAIDTLALPFFMEKQTLDHKEAGRTCNPLDLLGTDQNSTGNLAFAGLRVRIEAL